MIYACCCIEPIFHFICFVFDFTKAFQISFNLTSAAAAAAMRNTKNNANNSNNKSHQQQYQRPSTGNSARSKMNYIPPQRSINSNQPSLLHSINTINKHDAGRMANDNDDDNDDDGGRGNQNGDDDDDALKQQIYSVNFRLTNFFIDLSGVRINFSGLLAELLAINGHYFFPSRIRTYSLRRVFFDTNSKNWIIFVLFEKKLLVINANDPFC